ncbi:hypothetical protein ACFO25_09260 [Paenactinomyces guangxiensis]|uniref:Uncharacterized protein n=1 Tax=Paenactinomyces guangxiensis TaxID=1490290 RepID=A0A7W2A755_9BACL|nr:hypothetical protein [Paenactinomyces guangxiensis]MBA4492767.1 hypothetical protein [Paenactinomyces guangxiensis]MBH8590384.1 hypothetical protein [Paenactinomyces guangxiensis]
MENPLFSFKKHPGKMTEEKVAEWLQTGGLLPPGVPFDPRFMPLPEWQFAYQVTLIQNGNQSRQMEAVQSIVPVQKPESYELLLYMLASEVNTREQAGLNRENSGTFFVTGHLGLGLVVAVGEKVKRVGRVNIGEMVTVNLLRKSILPDIAGGKTDDYHSWQRRMQQGTHQQFTLSHISQVTSQNHLWEGYWNQRELSIKIVPFANLEKQTEDLDETDICVIRHALPRLDLLDSKQLFQVWTEGGFKQTLSL